MTYTTPIIKWNPIRGLYGVSTAYKRKFATDISMLTQQTAEWDPLSKTWFFKEEHLDIVIKICTSHFRTPVVHHKDEKFCFVCSAVLTPSGRQVFHDPQTNQDYCINHASKCAHCNDRIPQNKTYCHTHEPKRCARPQCVSFTTPGETFCYLHLHETCNQCKKQFTPTLTNTTGFCSRICLEANTASRKQQRQSLFNRSHSNSDLEKFCRLIGIEALTAAYKKAVVLYHPDTNPSCNGKMAEINGIWMKVKKELEETK